MSSELAPRLRAIDSIRHSERFACDVHRADDGRIVSLTVMVEGTDGERRAIRIDGNAATRAAASLHDILRAGGVHPKAWSQRGHFEIDPVTGAHAELLLLATKPITRLSHLEPVAEGVATMSREEASYWHAKSRQPGGLPALRILLTGGRHR